ncbi:MAG: FAD-dependent oxidoreductase, partial [Thermoguttaceae bacterium]|nr:FAD-dependent oxidoreductase [Thermoguttaceae bacterium]
MSRPVIVVAAFFLIAATAVHAPAAHTTWLEAEQFENIGGWTTDAQFIDQMGSPYLLATGMGKPVEDAVTIIRPPAAGRYRVWVRTCDWIPEHHPGRFQLVLGSKPLELVFGQSGKPGWRWEDGGVVEVAGPTELRLRDLAGYYGRCDVIVLSNDLGWTPPDDMTAIETLRIAHGGLSPVETIGPSDVVVIGGGLAGCTAAVAAARNGASVVLIQNRPVLGGAASTEILTPPVGVAPSAYRKKYPLDPRETGLLEEYRTAGNQRVAEGKLYSGRLLRFVEQEPRLKLFLNTHATGVKMHGGPGQRIAAVVGMHVHTGRRMRFPGALFIDCTGDGVVGVAAGADYRHGKESKAMHGEPWAPEEPSPHTMGNGLKYYAREFDEPQPFTAPPWAMRFTSCDDFMPGRHPRLPRWTELDHQWVNELGGLRDTYAEAEAIRDDLLRLIFGLWDHTKNHCERDRERAANYKLIWVGYVTCKRENRRLLGDYILTQNDIGDQTLFPDRVAFGGWICDDHHSAGFFHDGSFGVHYDDPANAHQAVPFSIPWRSLYSRNMDNLLMAGRNISATHIAMSNTRVMLTCALMGHAAGTGSALCLRHGTTPRGLYRHHIAELQQQLLKEGARVIGMKADDPRDLALRAEATASSTGVQEDGTSMPPGNVVNGYARAKGEGLGAQTNAWAPAGNAGGPHWIELAWQEPVDFSVVHVTFQTTELAPGWFAVEAQSPGETSWRRIAEVDANRHRRLVLGVDRTNARRLRVLLREHAGICEIRVYDEPPEVVAAARRAFTTMRLPDEGPYF